MGRPPGEGTGYPLQYSGLENSMDYTVHGVSKSRTWLSNFHIHTHTGSFNFVCHYDEVCGIVWASQGVLVVKKLPASAGDMGLILGWGRFPGGGRDSPGQHSCLENPHGQSSLAGCSPWGRKEPDTTEQLSRHACTWHCIWPSFHNRDSDFSKLCFLSLTTSRNKTWAGVFAGILFNAFLSWNFSNYSNVYTRRNMIQWWIYAPSLALSNIKLWQLLQTDYLCLSKIHMLNANVRCDASRSWDLWGGNLVRRMES